MNSIYITLIGVVYVLIGIMVRGIETGMDGPKYDNPLPIIAFWPVVVFLALMVKFGEAFYNLGIFIGKKLGGSHEPTTG